MFNQIIIINQTFAKAINGNALVRARRQGLPAGYTGGSRALRIPGKTIRSFDPAD
jgi:hypothetical protein